MPPAVVRRGHMGGTHHPCLRPCNRKAALERTCAGCAKALSPAVGCPVPCGDVGQPPAKLVDVDAGWDVPRLSHNVPSRTECLRRILLRIRDVQVHNAESVKVMARSGELPGLKVRGKWRFTQEAVEQFVVHRNVTGGDNVGVQCDVPRGKEQECLSSNAVKYGGAISRYPVEGELESLLARGIARRRKSFTI